MVSFAYDSAETEYIQHCHIVITWPVTNGDYMLEEIQRLIGGHEISLALTVNTAGRLIGRDQDCHPVYIMWH